MIALAGRVRAATLVATLTASLATPAAAGADPGADLSTATAHVANAGMALEAARHVPSSGPARVALLAPAVEGYELALSELRGAVAAAEAREQALSLGIESRREEVARLLAALGAMSRTPPPETALHPQGPAAAARAAAITARLAPALRQQADTLSSALAELSAAQALDAQGTGALESGLATLAAAQGELVAAMALAAPLSAPDAPDLVALARDSETLTALAAALAKSPSSGPPSVDGGPMSWPVPGDVVRHFDEADAAGARRPGLVLRAAPLALVRAPAAATVRYAGPFLEYGYVLVLQPAADTMVVLAGLAHLQVGTGDVVGRGDLLGLLGGRPLGVEEYVMLPQADTGAGGSETLYIEVRQGQRAVDPEPLFEAKG